MNTQNRLKHSLYEFHVYPNAKKWGYVIYGQGCPPYDDGKIHAEDWFDTEQEAEFAAIGHIVLLENREG